ncbi:MAG: pyridoxal-phosphate dependent enzyme [Bacteroidota bacterium]
MANQSTLDILYKLSDQALLYQSRIHPWHTRSHPSRQVWVKREDEGSFGISGCKKRKYASLIPFLIQSGYTQVVLIGGLRSNHIAGLTQLLIEHRIRPIYFLKKSHQAHTTGNELLFRLMTKDAEIHWIEGKAWGEVEQLAATFVDRATVPTYLIPEGGTCAPAVAGASTLYRDIKRNETACGYAFDHIFIDSGTALMAGVLACMMAKDNHPGHLHVVLTAGDVHYFSHQLHRIKGWLEQATQQTFPAVANWKTYRPYTAASFGAVNRTVLDYVMHMAQTEGIITDPIYSAKLFMNAEHQIKAQNLSGNILVIHSGGGMGLMGFGERILGQL